MTPEILAYAKKQWESFAFVDYKDLAACLEEAITLERERCARVAETWTDPAHREFRPEAFGCFAAFDEGLACSAPLGIAAAIREVGGAPLPSSGSGGGREVR
jgi:hypothetical protein